MKALLLSILLLPQPSCVKMEIILVGDMSGSVQGKESFITSAFVSFVSKMSMSEDGIRMGVISFNSSATLRSSLTGKKEDVVAALSGGWVAGHETNLNEALYLAVDEFSKSRPDATKILILISDGLPDSPAESLLISQQMAAFGINVFGVFVSTWNDEKGEAFLQRFVSNPAFYVRSDYEGLVEQLKKLDVCL